MKIEVTPKKTSKVSAINCGGVFFYQSRYWIKADDSDLPSQMQPGSYHYVCLRLADGKLSCIDATEEVEVFPDAKLVV